MNNFLEDKKIVKTHLFNLNSFFTMERNVWVVSKKNPNKPLVKINESDFGMIKSNIFKKYNNKISFNGKDYYVSDAIINQIKVQLKLNKVNINDISFSMQEYLNEDLIKMNKPKIVIPKIVETISKQNGIIKLIADDTYIADTYNEFIVEKLKEKMMEIGISIPEIFYMKESFFEDLYDDDVIMKKAVAILGEVTGMKIHDFCFVAETKEDISNADNDCVLTVYDDAFTINEYKKTLGGIYEHIYNNSSVEAKQILDYKYNTGQMFFTFCIENLNSSNRTETKETFRFKKPRSIKTFESFTVMKRYDMSSDYSIYKSLGFTL